LLEQVWWTPKSMLRVRDTIASIQLLRFCAKGKHFLCLMGLCIAYVSLIAWKWNQQREGSFNSARIWEWVIWKCHQKKIEFKRTRRSGY